MSKYDPLREHLARLDDVVWAAKLDDVENILGSNLPKSAREHRTWWANSGGSLVHQNAWLDAGWRVERTDLTRNVVVFRRLRIGGTSLASRDRSAEGAAQDKKSEAEKQLAKAMPLLRQPVTVTLRAEWTVLGDFHKVTCSATVIPEGAGILRLVSLREGEPKSLILPVGSVREQYRRLRMAIMETGAEAESELLVSLGLNRATPVECDVVKSGNAWLLTDGRGRKANFEDGTERDLVAELLYLQERQNGRAVQLISDLGVGATGH